MKSISHALSIGLTGLLTLSACSKQNTDDTPATPGKADASIAKANTGDAGNTGAKPKPDFELNFPALPSTGGMAGATSNPLPWRGVDIGEVGPVKGSVTMYTHSNDSQSFFVRASGKEIGGKSDSFYFLNQALKGDAEIWINLRSLAEISPGTKAGIMIRESADPAAAMIFLGTAGNGGVGGQVIARRSKGADAILQPAADAKAPLDDRLKAAKWLRLVREGNVFSAYAGTRAVAVKVASVELTLASPDADLLFGFAGTSGDITTPTFADLANLQLSNLLANPTYKNLELADVGTLGGTALISAGKLRITGWGQPWGSEPDNFREYFSYAFQTSQGEDSVTAKIESFQDSVMGGTLETTARAGLLFRAVDGAPPDRSFSFSRNSFGAALSLLPKGGLEWSARESKAVNDSFVPFKALKTIPDLKPPVWLRIDRSVSTLQMKLPNGFDATQTTIKVTGFYAMPGSAGGPGAWVSVGDASFPFGDTVLTNLGAHVASTSLNRLATMEVSEMTFKGGAAPPKKDVDAGGSPDARQDAGAPRDMGLEAIRRDMR